MPESRVQRAAPPRRRLLVCLDLQQASLAHAAPAPDPCIVNCRRVLAHARHAGWGVVHVHSKKACPVEARPIEGLEPLTSEPLVYRSGVSAFSSPAFRRMVGRRPCELVIIGYSMASSCLATAMVAYDQDLTVTLVEDAVSATPLDAVTRDALDVVARQIARPFVGLTSTGELLGQHRLLRVV
jgi:nicotinamidase-related amidase